MQKLLLLLFIPFVFSACKKEESPDAVDPAKPYVEPFPGPKAALMVAKKWKLTDKTVEYSNGLPTETFSNVPACTKDNLISFIPTKKYTIDEATDVCPGNTPTTTLDWSTTNNEQIVVLNKVNWLLVSVSATTLVLRNLNTTTALTTTTTETYTAQ